MEIQGCQASPGAQIGIQRLILPNQVTIIYTRYIVTIMNNATTLRHVVEEENQLQR